MISSLSNNFLGFPPSIPDRSTAWKFPERLIAYKKEEAIWSELQRQLDQLGFQIKRGVFQDDFITSDPGHARSDVPLGDKAQTRRSRDGIWVKKASNLIMAIKCIPVSIKNAS